MRTDPHDQVFQDIVIHSMGPKVVSFCILPHFEVSLMDHEVAILLFFMEKESRKNLHQNKSGQLDFNGTGPPNFISVEKIDDGYSTITIGSFQIKFILDSQWNKIYKILKKWQKWSKEFCENDDDDFFVSISADKKAYSMFEK